MSNGIMTIQYLYNHRRKPDAFLASMSFPCHIPAQPLQACPLLSKDHVVNGNVDLPMGVPNDFPSATPTDTPPLFFLFYISLNLSTSQYSNKPLYLIISHEQRQRSRRLRTSPTPRYLAPLPFPNPNDSKAQIRQVRPSTYRPRGITRRLQSCSHLRTRTPLDRHPTPPVLREYGNPPPHHQRRSGRNRNTSSATTRPQLSSPPWCTTTSKNEWDRNTSPTSFSAPSSSPCPPSPAHS